VKSLVRVTDAATEPVTLAEASAFLRVDSTDDEALITTLIITARQMVEDFTGRALISQTWKLVQSEWPSGCSDQGRMMELERSPLISVETVKYYPASGAAQATLASDAYLVLTGPAPGIVYLKSDQDWPDIYDRPDAVEVNFTAGHANAAAVPRPLYHAVLLLIAHLYELRGPVNVGNIVTEIPYTIKHLLESHRVGGWVA
jgi:uncharacterized phiE125 gp8 family phage protein